MFATPAKYARKILALVLTRSSAGRKLAIRRLMNRGRYKIHPFDVLYGIQTSGFLDTYLLNPGLGFLKGENHPYGGCFPECVRRAVKSVPDVEEYAFYDLGCGMGRALVVASEFPFRELIGVELSDQLCAIARKNAAKIAAQYPTRTPIQIRHSDAGEVRFQGEKLVIFLYHSFGRAILAPIIARLEAAARQGHSIYLIFENPVNGDLVDDSALFTRVYGEQVACAPEERSHHFDEPDDAVVVWASEPGSRKDHCNFDIVVTKPGWRAEIVARPKIPVP
jgi:SAM-dependent methyltransferase